MNTAALRKYAPQARRDFLRAVTDRAAKVGLSEGKAPVPVEASGDAAIMGGQSFPRAFKSQRDRLAQKVADEGFGSVMEEAAYVWFNRLMALRYMEVHGYLDHGFRVLSHPQGAPRPEILEQAAHANLPGLVRGEVVSLLLDGNKDEELYRKILLAQCRALHEAMPFLFEPVDDVTELLLPDNLLASDSVVRRLAGDIGEEDWQQVEIVGWLYQFYISEEKARVDAAVKKGRAVKPSEIPAKTQIFTPNWIVKYMVQNSLGRLWLDIEPSSPLKANWEFWIEPAAQEPEVEAELARLAAETRAKHLTPETITFIDPCAGSGHILTDAYEIFKEMYQERGYARRDIPRLILEKNLFGLEIDPRAAQMAGFALLMKARADDRTILANPPRVNVLALRPSGDLDADKALAAFAKREIPGFAPTSLAPMLDGQGSLGDAPLAPSRELRVAVYDLIDLFEDADTLGALIQVPPKLVTALPALRERLVEAAPDLLSGPFLTRFAELVRQAELLALCADVAVTNPPYLEVSKVGEPLKGFAAKHYPKGKPDLYGCFMERCTRFAIGGYWAMINIPNWMFLSSFEKLREGITTRQTIDSLVHLGRGAFGSDFGTVAFVLRDRALPAFKGSFRRLFTKQGSVASLEELQRRFFTSATHAVSDQQFREIPGSPIAYWVSKDVRKLFREGTALSRLVDSRQGLSTSDNGRFVRYWWEVAPDNIGLGCAGRDQARGSQKRWFPFNKGGEFRRWYGNLEHVVDWEDDGRRLFSLRPKSVLRSPECYFMPSVSWSKVGIGANSFRYYGPGAIFADAGMSAFNQDESILLPVLAYANSPIVQHILPAINPTVNLDIGYFQILPFPDIDETTRSSLTALVVELGKIAKADWDDRETSMDFTSHPAIRHGSTTMEHSFQNWNAEAQARIGQTLELESSANELLATAARLQNELNALAKEADCVWLRPDQATLTRTFLSYVVGVLMGRWEQEQGAVDDDGILPVSDGDWFGADDTAARVADFVGRVWPREGLADNLRLLARGLGTGADEVSLDAIRRYLATTFFKDHLQTYRKRPIYWLFSSGKERAFQALVYLHRYNPGTLSRMRTEYVGTLQKKMNARIDQLAADIAASTTTAERRRREKAREALQRQAVELRAYDEKLRHYADQRIELDLDDGVRVNYAKFGDLLAENAKIVGDNDD